MDNTAMTGMWRMTNGPITVIMSIMIITTMLGLTETWEEMVTIFLQAGRLLL